MRVGGFIPTWRVSPRSYPGRATLTLPRHKEAGIWLILDRLACSGFYVRSPGNVTSSRVLIVRVMMVRSSIYVALKIHAANVDVSKELSIQQHLSANSNDSGSNFVLLLLDSFVLEGPNGKHHCFVTKAMGPSVSAVLQAPFEFYEPDNPPSHRFPTLRSRNFLRDTLTGLAFIHGNNIVHGDLQAGNLLFSLSDINTLNPQELEQNEANSNLEPLLRIDGKVDRWAPKYLVVPEPLVEEAMPQNEQTVTVADFGGGKPSYHIVYSNTFTDKSVYLSLLD